MTLLHGIVVKPSNQLKGNVSTTGLWPTFLAITEQDNFLMIESCVTVICIGNSALTCVINFLDMALEQQMLPFVFFMINIMCLQCVLTGK